MLKTGDVILASVQFTDSFEVKKRPAVVLFEERGNVVVAGVTSNTHMQGIPLSTREGAAVESVIKLNYLFTISKAMIHKFLFRLPAEKKRLVFSELAKRLQPLND